MAVFTPISRAHLLDFLDDYDLGTLESFQGIMSGTQNTNYHVYTSRGHFILTLFEPWGNLQALPFVFSFTRHLGQEGIRCPRALINAQGEMFGEIADRKAALVTFLDGQALALTEIGPEHCSQIGDLVACMHVAARGFKETRPNALGLPVWKEIAARCAPRADEVEPGLAAFIAAELDALEREWPSDGLPRAVVHTDIFADNVFFRGGKLHGVIDFYFACTDFLVYDLMMAVNAWCFDTAHRFMPERYEALMNAYEEVRPLEAAERRALSLMGRASAMRILLTRLNDWLFHDPASLVTPHDPRDFVARLRFHRGGGAA